MFLAWTMALNKDAVFHLHLHEPHNP